MTFGLLKAVIVFAPGPNQGAAIKIYRAGIKAGARRTLAASFRLNHKNPRWPDREMIEIETVFCRTTRDIVKNSPAVRFQRFKLFRHDAFTEIPKIAVTTFLRAARKPASGLIESRQENDQR